MSSENEVLRSSLPLLWPVWALALLAGFVYEEYSHWFGCTLVVPLVYVVYRASKRLWTAKEVNVKLVEVVLLNLAVPLIAVLGTHRVFASAVNLMLISSAIMHFQLLVLTSDKLTRLCMSLLVAVSGVLTFLVFVFDSPSRYERPLVTPTSTALVYLLLLVWFWILRVPQKLPLRAFCITLVLLSTAFIIYVCVMTSATELVRMKPDLLIFGCGTLVIVAFPCVREYLVCRYPGKELVVNSSMFGSAHLICMLLAAAYSLYDRSGSHHRGSEDYICDVLCAYWFIVLFAVVRYFWHRLSFLPEGVYDQEEPLPTEESQKKWKKQVVAIAALEALLLSCNYVAATNGCDPLSEPVLMILSALILLALTNRLDKLRTLLAPHNYKLVLTALVLAIYAFSTGFYLAHYGTLGNGRVEWRNVDITTEKTSANTLIGILWITSGFFVNLAVHLAFAIAEQKKKAWMRLPAVAKVTVFPFKPETDKSHHGMGI